MMIRNRWAKCAQMGTFVAFSMLTSSTAWAASHVNRGIMAESVEWFVTSIPAGKTQKFIVSGPNADMAAFHIFDANTLSPIVSETGNSISYTNPDTGNLKNVAILIHSRRANIEGTVLLQSYRDGALVAERDIWLGGNIIQTPCGIGPLDYETAPRPGGKTDTILFGFDSEYNAIAYDNDSGVHDASRLLYEEDVCQILVSHVAGSEPGLVDLYVNDHALDADGDGLGVLLENALGTCDSTSDPGCSDVYNPRDSDRDGLDDMLEIFGLDSDPPLLLPAWGANPLHKDLFMEVDSHPNDTVKLNAAKLRKLQELYGEGPADQLQNPDGLPGVAVHFDVGKNPTDNADLTLFGAWGGSNAIATDLCKANKDGTYPSACLRDKGQTEAMAEHRRGIFYYGVSNPSGGGQAVTGGGRGHFGPGALNTAHELGHAIGLKHGGHSGSNCKPNYPSLMNYATLYDPPSRFFSGTDVTSMSRYYAQELDPFGQLSSSPPVGLTTDHMSNDSWLLGGDGLNVDWNGNGVGSGVWRLSVQQAITESEGGGCEIGAKDPVPFRSRNESDGVLSSPSLARLGHYFISEGDAFSTIAAWAEGDGKVRLRAVRDDGPLQDGGCIDGCANPRDAITLSGVDDIKGVAAAQFMQYQVNTLPQPYFGLALRDSNDQLRFALSRNVQYTEDGYSLAQEVDSSVPWEFVDLGVTTSKTPEIVQMTVNINGGMQNGLAIIYVDQATSEYHWVVLPAAADPAVASNWVKKGRLLDKNNGPLVASKAEDDVIGKYRPSVTVIPINPFFRAVGVFGTGNGRAYAYAYIAERDQWERRIQVGKISAAPSIAIAHERVGTALVGGNTPTAYNAANPNQARIVVAFRKEGSDKYPAMYLTKFFNVSDIVDVDAELPKDRIIGITNIWGKATGSEPIDIYQDLYTGALRAALIQGEGKDDDKKRKLKLFPWADGTGPDMLAVRSDFEFMERHVCMGVRSILRDGDNYCGDKNSTKSGL